MNINTNPQNVQIGDFEKEVKWAKEFLLNAAAPKAVDEVFGAAIVISVISVFILICLLVPTFAGTPKPEDNTAPGGPQSLLVLNNNPPATTLPVNPTPSAT